MNLALRGPLPLGDAADAAGGAEEGADGDGDEGAGEAAEDVAGDRGGVAGEGDAGAGASAGLIGARCNVDAVGASVSAAGGFCAYSLGSQNDMSAGAGLGAAGDSADAV